MIVFGDFYTKIGKEDHIKQVTGKYTINEKTNDSGHKLCNLVAQL